MPAIRTLESHVSDGVFVYVERSKDLKELSESLVLAMGLMDEPKKNRKGQYGEYADLSALRRAARGPLAQNGLAVLQTFHPAGDDLILNTTLLHKTGQYVSSQVPIKVSQNPQHTSAYCTYMRRMAYASMLGLSSEDDDDGESAADAAAQDSKTRLLDLAAKKLAAASTVEEIDALLSRAEERLASEEISAADMNEIRKRAGFRKQALSRKEQK